MLHRGIVPGCRTAARVSVHCRKHGARPERRRGSGVGRESYMEALINEARHGGKTHDGCGHRRCERGIDPLLSKDWGLSRWLACLRSVPRSNLEWRDSHPAPAPSSMTDGSFDRPECPRTGGTGCVAGGDVSTMQPLTAKVLLGLSLSFIPPGFSTGSIVTARFARSSVGPFTRNRLQAFSGLRRPSERLRPPWGACTSSTVGFI